MKKVIIFNKLCKLTPFWFKKLCKMKGKEVFFYTEQYDENYNFLRYVKYKENADFNDFNKVTFDIDMYAYKDFGDEILEEYPMDLYVYNIDMILNCIKMREDKTFIKLIDSLIKDNIVKIIDIPEDVKYFIQENEIGECIVEEHRVWE